jgi:hypothetical protein
MSRGQAFREAQQTSCRLRGNTGVNELWPKALLSPGGAMDDRSAECEKCFNHQEPDRDCGQVL